MATVAQTAALPAARSPISPGHPLVVEHLTKRYGHRKVIDDLSFRAPPGRITGFLGPNGSGKSTTMKILLDLAAADSGTATIGGRRYRDLPDPARSVGAVLEPNAFHPGRSGRNHLLVVADAAGIPTGRVDEVLTEVGLSDESARRRVSTYSLGMKQRLSLAGALLGQPSVLILDEPANGLDPQGIRALREVLQARAAQGHTVLVSSHLLGEVQLLADDVVVISHGRLVTAGRLEDLTQASSVVRTDAAETLAHALTAAGAAVERTAADALVVTGMPIDLIGDTAHAEGIALHELAPQARSLEDLFLAWTAEPTGTHEEAPQP